MYRDKERYGQNPSTVLRSKSKFNFPLTIKEPHLIFTCSWSDWFIKEADPWQKEAWEIIKATPQHTYQILTKRADRIQECLPADWGDGYDNVWLGVSIESDAYLDRAIELKKIPAKVRFLSMEPLLSQTTLGRAFMKYETTGADCPYPGNCYENSETCTSCGHQHTNELGDIHWVIVGGESGNETGKYKYRPCEFDWITDIVKQCRAANVPLFVKQTGTYLARAMGLKDRHGGNIEEWPSEIQVRQMPEGFEFMV